ncbi:MAG: response regulator [Flavobacteriales bacterium]|nr:response regulator [Flavobacteriales bacterium]
MSQLDFKILLIDDDKIANLINKRVLEKTNQSFEIDTVGNGEEGVQYIRKALLECEQFPSVIFLDINMPKLNGWELLKEYNDTMLSNPKVDKNIIIMLTTSVDPRDKERADKDESVIKFLSKPLKAIDLPYSVRLAMGSLT